jgi:hypothetical protein
MPMPNMSVDVYNSTADLDPSNPPSLYVFTTRPVQGAQPLARRGYAGDRGPCAPGTRTAELGEGVRS